MTDWSKASFAQFADVLKKPRPNWDRFIDNKSGFLQFGDLQAHYKANPPKDIAEALHARLQHIKLGAKESKEVDDFLSNLVKKAGISKQPDVSAILKGSIELGQDGNILIETVLNKKSIQREPNGDIKYAEFGNWKIKPDFSTVKTTSHIGEPAKRPPGPKRVLSP